MDDLKERLRAEAQGNRDGHPTLNAPMLDKAADRIAQLETALAKWIAYDDLDEADFSQVGPMLLYAEAINEARRVLNGEQG